MQTDVLIVGGGLAGLSCAVALADSGLRITLVEETAELGGRARSWRDAVTGDAIDIGPHILLTEYRNMLRLLDTLGTRDAIDWQTDRVITLLEARRRSIMRLSPLTPPLHFLPSLLKVSSISARDKLSNFAAVRLAMRLQEADVQRLDAQPADQLLRELGVSERFRDWFWKSACIALMNVPLEQCSAGALFRVYAQLMGHNDYRIGFAAKGLAELFVPGTEAILARGKGLIFRSCAVRRLHVESGRCSGAQLTDGTRIDARYVVLAVPPEAARQLMTWSPLHVFQPSPYISIYLWFDRKLTDLKFWARIWNPHDLNCDFYDLSNIRAGWKARPSVIASNIIYSGRAADLSDAQIVARTVAEIADFAPEAASARVTHASVHRIPMAIPCPHPDTERHRPDTATSVGGLLLAGDWTRTGLPASMEGAVCSGFKAAEHIWHGEGRPRELALPPRPTEGLAGLRRQLAR